jgi:hypothetical protein
MDIGKAFQVERIGKLRGYPQLQITQFGAGNSIQALERRGQCSLQFTRLNHRTRKTEKNEVFCAIEALTAKPGNRWGGLQQAAPLSPKLALLATRKNTANRPPRKRQKIRTTESLLEILPESIESTSSRGRFARLVNQRLPFQNNRCQS